MRTDKMKSPVAKHMNTYNKASVVRHKHVSMREVVALQEMEEDAAQSVLEGFMGDTYSFTSEDDCYSLCDIGCSGICISNEEE